MESLDLPADSNSVKLARAFVGRHADQHLADPFLATLLTSELVANVVRHARTSLRVSVTVGPHFGLRCTTESRRPRPSEPSSPDRRHRPWRRRRAVAG